MGGDGLTRVSLIITVGFEGAELLGAQTADDGHGDKEGIATTDLGGRTIRLRMILGRSSRLPTCAARNFEATERRRRCLVTAPQGCLVFPTKASLVQE